MLNLIRFVHRWRKNPGKANKNKVFIAIHVRFWLLLIRLQKRCSIPKESKLKQRPDKRGRHVPKGRAKKKRRPVGLVDGNNI